RVGNGPFPTELFDEVGATIQKEGAEFGSVSKRPRRCGWLDLPMLRTASRLSGFDYIALTKLDVLSNLKEIKICTHYLLGKKKVLEIHATKEAFAKFKPVFKTFPGWQSNINDITSFSLLPRETKTYIQYIGKNLGVPIKIISVGAERKKNLYL